MECPISQELLDVLSLNHSNDFLLNIFLGWNTKEFRTILRYSIENNYRLDEIKELVIPIQGLEVACDIKNVDLIKYYLSKLKYVDDIAFNFCLDSEIFQLLEPQLSLPKSLLCYVIRNDLENIKRVLELNPINIQEGFILSLTYGDIDSIQVFIDTKRIDILSGLEIISKIKNGNPDLVSLLLRNI